MDTWVEWTERNRRSAIARWYIILALFGASLWLRATANGGGEGSLLADAAVAVLVVAALFSLFFLLMRPKTITIDGITSVGYLALLPVGGAKAAGFETNFANNDNTMWGRLVFAPNELIWIPAKSYSTQQLRWSRVSVKSLALQKMKNLTPLGYLRLETVDGSVSDMRVFNLKQIGSHLADYQTKS
ncbi:hypothetical protein HJC99_01860 [Candidatus Saccharibacteria bacterium]|nr:hypothetical protein [Candidatus Saccharibacteria bacterium]